MGQAPSGQGGGPPPERDPEKEKAERERRKKSYAARPPLHTGRRRRRNRGTGTSGKLPKVYPTSKCKLRLLKLERIKDYLLMEQEFIRNQEVFKPHEEKDKEERDKMEDIRGSPLAVGSLEEMIDDTHAIVSSSVGPEYYVSVMSFVNQDLLEPGCSVLLHNKVMGVVGILSDDTDPMVSVMKVDKARPRRPVVQRRLHFTDTTRVQERRPWLVSSSILGRVETATPRAGAPRELRGHRRPGDADPGDQGGRGAAFRSP